MSDPTIPNYTRVLFYDGEAWNHRYEHEDGRAAVVANHGSKIIPLGTMRSIMKQSGLPDDAWS